MKLIFTLEFKGKLIARQVIRIKVCSVPIRARMSEERKANPKAENASRKRKRDPEKEPFIITVYKKEHFDILTNLANALELAEMMNSKHIMEMRRLYLASRQ